MKTKTKSKNKSVRLIRGFKSVEFFREIKKKLAKRMTGMTLEEQKEFLRKVRSGEIKIA